MKEKVKLNAYQIAQRARRAREASVMKPVPPTTPAQRALRKGSLDDLAEGLIAVAKSGTDAQGLILRVFANLPMPEAWLLCRVVLGLLTQGAGGVPLGGVAASEFVKALGRIANVQSDHKGY